MATLDRGDVVQLKSGGQVTTIGYIDKDGTYSTCYRFDHKGEFHKKQITVVALKPASAEDEDQIHV